MPQSSTSSQTDKVHRHFTEIWKIFTGYATITDGIFLSVYFQREFFLHAFSICKTISNIFFPDRLNDGMWDYRWKTYQQTLSIDDLVGKKFTDEVWISHRRIRSVDKTVKSGSVYSLIAGVFINKRKSFTKPKNFTA